LRLGVRINHEDLRRCGRHPPGAHGRINFQLQGVVAIEAVRDIGQAVPVKIKRVRRPRDLPIDLVLWRRPGAPPARVAVVGNTDLLLANEAKTKDAGCQSDLSL
jgi:hypothetical protein